MSNKLLFDQVWSKRKEQDLMSHSLYWHLATFAPSQYREFPPPHRHQLIAIAGIEVLHDPDKAPQVKTVWAKMASRPLQLLQHFADTFGHVTDAVGVFTNTFGMPVLYANCLRTGFVADVFLDNSVAEYDLADEVRQLVAPERHISFADILLALGLPERPDLDIPAIWVSSDPKIKKRIPARLLVDCCLIACIESRLRRLRGEWSPEYCEAVEAAVIEAARQKIPAVVRKVFGPDAD